MIAGRQRVDRVRILVWKNDGTVNAVSPTFSAREYAPGLRSEDRASRETIAATLPDAIRCEWDSREIRGQRPCKRVNIRLPE